MKSSYWWTWYKSQWHLSTVRRDVRYLIWTKYIKNRNQLEMSFFLKVQFFLFAEPLLYKYFRDCGSLWHNCFDFVPFIKHFTFYPHMLYLWPFYHTVQCSYVRRLLCLEWFEDKLLSRYWILWGILTTGGLAYLPSSITELAKYYLLQNM